MIATVAVCPLASTPPDCVHVTRPTLASTAQVKVAVLPAETVTATGVVMLLRPLIQPGTVSSMRMPVAGCAAPTLALLTTSV